MERKHSSPLNKAKKTGVKRIFLVILLTFLADQVFWGDVVKLKNGEERSGVILDRGVTGIVIATEKGNEEIDIQDVSEVVMEDENENLIFLADRADRAGETSAALNLYTKVFWNDPFNEEANKGIGGLDPEMLSDEDAKSWVGGYERYQTSPGGDNDGEILSGDSGSTEDLLTEFGLVIASESGRIKVTEVVRGSRAWKGGLQINDFLIEIGQRAVLYMGKFDVVNVLLAEGEKPIFLEIEREIRQWIGERNDSVKVAAVKGTGDSPGRKDLFMIIGGKGLLGVSDKGAAYGDIIVSIDGVAVEPGLSLEEVRRMIEKTGPNNVYMVVRRKIFI